MSDSVAVRYIGAEERFSEVAITGQQQVWSRGQSSQVSHANADLLLATGLFEFADGDIITITGNTTLSNHPVTGHNGKVLRCLAAVTLTYPEGLGAEFSCLVESPASGDVTIDPTGACTVNGATASLTRGRTNNPAGFVIRALAANVAGVSGS